MSDTIKDYGSLKLLGVLLALQTLAKEQGIDLALDSATIVNRWQRGSGTNPLQAYLALNSLRQLDSHPKGTDFERKLKTALIVFGVTINATANGWGLALDKIYDVISAKLAEVANLLEYAQ